MNLLAFSKPGKADAKQSLTIADGPRQDVALCGVQRGRVDGIYDLPLSKRVACPVCVARLPLAVALGYEYGIESVDVDNVIDL
jgi:hypothetical protein